MLKLNLTLSHISTDITLFQDSKQRYPFCIILTQDHRLSAPSSAAITLEFCFFLVGVSTFFFSFFIWWEGLSYSVVHNGLEFST